MATASVGGPSTNAGITGASKAQGRVREGASGHVMRGAIGIGFFFLKFVFLNAKF